MVQMRDDRDGLAASRLETKMLRILRRIKRHRFVLQHRVEDGPRTYFLDAAFPDERVAIECQGIKWHMGEERFKSDLRRDRRLSLLGWTILYFTWDDVVLAPNQVEMEIREALTHSFPRHRT
jgi:very-short-patch-repair endonuclease